MEIVTWIGAIEAAVGILYLALFGQRSIIEWIDARRREREAPKGADLPQGGNAPKPLLRSRPRVLSIQSLGDFIEYWWRDPIEAAVVTGKAIGIGGVLLFGGAGLLLLLSGILAGAAGFFSGNAVVGSIAGQMDHAGWVSLLIVLPFFIIGIMSLASIDELPRYRKQVQEVREREERERKQQRTQEVRAASRSQAY